MQVYQIINSVGVLNEIMANKLPIAVSYKLKKVADEANIILEQFNEKRTSLLEELGTMNDAGTGFQFSDENRDKFNEKLTIFGEEEVDVVMKKLTIDELGSVEIEPNKLTLIEWFIEA